MPVTNQWRDPEGCAKSEFSIFENPDMLGAPSRARHVLTEQRRRGLVEQSADGIDTGSPLPRWRVR